MSPCLSWTRVGIMGAVYTTILSLYNMGISSLAIVLLSKHDTAPLHHIIVHGAAVFSTLLWLVFSALVLCGLKKEKHDLLLPWLLLTPFLTIIILFGVGTLLFDLDAVRQNRRTLINIIFQSILALANIFSWTVILFLYRTMKEDCSFHVTRISVTPARVYDII